MQITALEISLAFIASLALSTFLTGAFRLLAIKFKIYDNPSQSHKTHVTPIPYLGGLSIMMTFLITFFAFGVINFEALGNLSNHVLFFLSPMLLGVIGLIDDLRNLSTRFRLLSQTLGAVFVVIVYSQLDVFGSPFSIYYLNIAISIFWIVGLINAINFIDNLDGGAGGVVLISTITLAVSAALTNQFAIAATAMFLCGATLGFLFWNLNPARIYMGDAGALFVGCLISSLILRYEPPTNQQFLGWFFAFSLMALPILDTCVVVTSRLSRGLSPLLGGQDHLSHRLISKGLSRRRAAYVIWSIAGLFCGIGSVIIFVPSNLGLVLFILGLVIWLCLYLTFLSWGNSRVEAQ